MRICVLAPLPVSMVSYKARAEAFAVVAFHPALIGSGARVSSSGSVDQQARHPLWALVGHPLWGQAWAWPRSQVCRSRPGDSLILF